MSYYLPIEYYNISWEYLDHLIKIKLYMNRYTLPNIVTEFYEDLYNLIEEKSSLPWSFDYLENKSKNFFKYVGFYWFDHGESIQCNYTFKNEVMEFIDYEYFLDPHSGNTTAEQILGNLDDECFIEQLHYKHVTMRNESYKYGESIDHPSPFLLEVSLKNIVEDMDMIDKLIHKRMFIFKRILTHFKIFSHYEYIFSTKINHSFFKGWLFFSLYYT